MRYVLEKTETQDSPAEGRQSARYGAELRRELSERNIMWSRKNKLDHEVTLGGVPAVLYREDEEGRHGNFHPAAYSCIQRNPAWSRRLRKVHTTARKVLLSRDDGRRELDSCNSSDALLMSIFCHPQPGGRLRLLLNVEAAADPIFGYRPRVPLKNDRADSSEIDLRLGNLLVEAKLTEYGFQTAPWRLAERYRDLEEVFDVEDLPRSGASLLSYQLVRGVLAAHAEEGARYCVLCDARRPDLIASWYRVLRCVRYPGLSCRLMLVTWQEVSAACTGPLQLWLDQKYGI
jgi:hypothetical protein